MTALALEGVACVRGDRTLFEGLSFALGPGDAALVTGPNGAGKSSLVRIAAGLLRPAGGRVTKTGDLALLAEASALDPDRTLAQALGFWAAIDGTRIEAALANLDLAHLAEMPVRFLSTGQRRRANGLDAAAVARLEALIARHRGGGGIALVATHLPVKVADAHQLHLPGKSRADGLGE